MSWLFIGGNIVISLVAVIGGRMLQQSLRNRTEVVDTVATA